MAAIVRHRNSMPEIRSLRNALMTESVRPSSSRTPTARLPAAARARLYRLAPTPILPAFAVLSSG